jgi:cyclohexanecarboxyl-CoA dehydrogenase
MISFAFSPEQEAFRTDLRRFAAAELAPRYLDRACSPEFPWQAHRQLAEMGVLGLGLPERFGGSGESDPITLGLAAETLAYGDPNVAAAPVQVGLVAAQLAGLAQDDVAERYVPRLISGEIVAAIAVTEPSAGSDAANLASSVRAVPPLQQRYRDVDSYLVADGTAAIQKRIIATSLLGRVAAQ